MSNKKINFLNLKAFFFLVVDQDRKKKPFGKFTTTKQTFPLFL